MKTQAGGYASPPGVSAPHQAALAWVLANPGVATTTIPSMTSYAQVEENLGACGKRFTLADRVALGRYALEIGVVIAVCAGHAAGSARAASRSRTCSGR